MNLDELTPNLLESALRALQQAETPPMDLLHLAVLAQTESATRVEQSLALEALLTRLVERALTAQRQAEGLHAAPAHTAPNRAALLQTLAADFGCGNATLESWSALYYRYLSSIPFSVDELAGAAHVALQQYRRRLKQGLAYLAVEVSKAELAARRQQLDSAGLHLPLPEYGRLFGIETHLRRLTKQIDAAETSCFLSVEGLGGIGKTALARALAQRVLERGAVQDVLWVSARQVWLSDNGAMTPVQDAAHSTEDIVTRLTLQAGMRDLAGAPLAEKLERLRRVARESIYLIVVDNLETLADAAQLLPALASLSGKSHFVLTSRRTLAQFPYISVFDVPELTLQDSQALLNDELQRRGRRSAAQPMPIEPIYAAIGGLPLALKLVAAQLSRLPLDTVLADLRAGERRLHDHLYTYIYYHTWQLLDPPAQHLLLAMLAIAPEGEDVGFLQEMSALNDAEFEQALTQLLDYSLLEIGDTLVAPRYRLHRLTITFLQTSVLSHWHNV